MCQFLSQGQSTLLAVEVNAYNDKLIIFTMKSKDGSFLKEESSFRPGQFCFVANLDFLAKNSKPKHFHLKMLSYCCIVIVVWMPCTLIFVYQLLSIVGLNLPKCDITSPRGKIRQQHNGRLQLRCRMGNSQPHLLKRVGEEKNEYTTLMSHHCGISESKHLRLVTKQFSMVYYLGLVRECPMKDGHFPSSNTVHVKTLCYLRRTMYMESASLALAVPQDGIWSVYWSFPHACGRSMQQLIQSIMVYFFYVTTVKKSLTGLPDAILSH